MLILALAAVAVLAAAGWIAAWHARGDALSSDQSAAAAERRLRKFEGESSAIRLSEEAQRAQGAAAIEHLADARVKIASLQLELSTARADNNALRARLADVTPTSGELYDVTTRRLRAEAMLAGRTPS